MSHISRLVLSGPLSAQASFALYITGAWTSREAKNLARLLNLQIEWMEEETPATTSEQTRDTDNGSEG